MQSIELRKNDLTYSARYSPSLPRIILRENQSLGNLVLQVITDLVEQPLPDSGLVVHLDKTCAPQLLQVMNVFNLYGKVNNIEVRYQNC